MTFKSQTQAAAPRPGRNLGADSARPSAGMPRYLQRGGTSPPAHAGALPLSSPGDACEREADSVAAQLTDPRTTSTSLVVGGSPSAMPEAGGAGVLAPPVGASGGAALPQPLAARYGAQLGHDVSGVRVHAGSAASAAAGAVGASAYTVGHDIVFGSGAYAPGTPRGDRLMAHELAHVVQQSKSGRPALMRQPQPDAAVPAQQPAAPVAAPVVTGLEAQPEATRRTLKVDTDEAHGAGADPKSYFGLKGDIVTADNVDIDYELVTPGIDALTDDKVKSGLYKGLRGYALGIFDLIPDDKGKATTTRLNLVHHVNLDLTTWGGPSTAFRYTAIGGTTAGKIKVKVIVEQLAATFEPMAASEAGVEAAKATPNTLTKAALMPDATWKRVLRALDRVPAATLARIHDIEFDNSPDAKGGGGEAAEYLSVYKDGKWTRRIVIYASLRSGSDDQFAFTLIHELGHAIDFAPTQGAKGKEKDKEAHNDKAFKDAMLKDGGRAKAITTYGGTSDKEYYAECFAMFTQRPTTLEALRPAVYAYFVAFEASAAADAAAKAGAAATPAAPTP